MNSTFKPVLYALCFGAVATFAAPSAIAQGTSEEITVTGRYGQVPSSAQSASAVISYADLDLSTKAGRDMFKRRISLTSRYLCEKLGETESKPAVGSSCRDAATKDAMARAGTLEEGFAPRGTAWVAPSPWQAPYADDWAARYP